MPPLDWNLPQSNRTAVSGIDIETSDPILHRVWDPRSGDTYDITELEPDGGSVTVHPAVDAQRDILETIYRVDEDDESEFLGDVYCSDALKEVVRKEVNARQMNRHERSFGDSGVTIETEVDLTEKTTIDVHVPYSRYFQSLSDNPGGQRPTIPGPGDNDFTAYVHEPLVHAINATFDDVIGDDSDTIAYQRAGIIAEFVQSIPHRTDWQSHRALHYIRTPEEALVELKADCKDASLLLYHLYDVYDFEPAFVLLASDFTTVLREDIDLLSGDFNKKSGSAGGESGEKDAGEKSSEQLLDYPHHLAIGIPRRNLTPIPEEVSGSLTTFWRDDVEYVYVESTSQHPPGIYMDRRPRLSPVIYQDRRDFVEQVLPVL